MNHADPRPAVTVLQFTARAPELRIEQRFRGVRRQIAKAGRIRQHGACCGGYASAIFLCFTYTMTLNFKSPPQHVCLLRLSAIGDTCHAAAALRALQAAWPQTRFTWIIGKLEAKLMAAVLPEIEFITFDKGAMIRELRRLRTSLRGRRFDLLLDLQLSFRASLVSTLIAAPIKLGFDRARARELQWWFTNARIAPAAHGACAGLVHGIRARLRHRTRAALLEPRAAPGRARVRPRHRQRRAAHAADQPLLQPHGAQLAGRALCRRRRLRRRRPRDAGGAGRRPQLPRG